MKLSKMVCAVVLGLAVVGVGAGDVFGADEAVVLTPKPGAQPRVNGPKIFGVRPGNPFLYTIPATGDRPMTFSVDNLPAGLKLDAATGQITGMLAEKGEHMVTFRAKNAKGEATKPFKIVVGETICLTPPLGWNSWNCWATAVDQGKVEDAARVMSERGLVNHGWTYINIDDTWQGARGGKYNGIMSNEKFPDMKKLADDVHRRGLKLGIYSTPWITSYAGFVGGSSNNEKGEWSKEKNEGRRDGKILFAEADAKQWADWGVDYLKYDWNPRSNPRVEDAFFHKQVKDMGDALRKSGRDVVYSYSNSMPFDQIGEVSQYLNCWRTTGDISDSWFSMSGIGFTQDKWAGHASPGHWNDPDMLEVGYVGKSATLHPTKLTPNEQYTHISLWCLLSAPLLIGCDMTRMDDFTFSLLTNDEVLELDQDSLGKQARQVYTEGPDATQERAGRNGGPPTVRKFPSKQVWAKELEDGSRAIGLFNLADTEQKVTAKWSDVKVSGKQTVRDLWRQQDVGTAEGEYSATVPPHGVVLLKLTKAQ